MQTALHFKAQVLPGNRVEVHSPELSEGDPVDIFVILPEKTSRRSAIDILNQLPGKRLFKTAEEVDKYLQEERESWEL